MATQDVLYWLTIISSAVWIGPCWHFDAFCTSSPTSPTLFCPHLLMIQKAIWVFFVETVKKDDQRFEQNWKNPASIQHLIFQADSSTSQRLTAPLCPVRSLPLQGSWRSSLACGMEAILLKANLWIRNGGHSPYISLLLKLPQIKK